MLQSYGAGVCQCLVSLSWGDMKRGASLGKENGEAHRLKDPLYYSWEIYFEVNPKF